MECGNLYFSPGCTYLYAAELTGKVYTVTGGVKPCEPLLPPISKLMVALCSVEGFSTGKLAH